MLKIMMTLPKLNYNYVYIYIYTFPNINLNNNGDFTFKVESLQQDIVGSRNLIELLGTIKTIDI